MKQSVLAIGRYCVLLSPNSAVGMGHLGLLVQNEEQKCVLYSKNGGRGIYTSSAKTEEKIWRK